MDLTFEVSVSDGGLEWTAKPSVLVVEAGVGVTAGMLVSFGTE